VKRGQETLSRGRPAFSTQENSHAFRDVGGMAAKIGGTKKSALKPAAAGCGAQAPIEDKSSKNETATKGLEIAKRSDKGGLIQVQFSWRGLGSHCLALRRRSCGRDSRKAGGCTIGDLGPMGHGREEKLLCALGEKSVKDTYLYPPKRRRVGKCPWGQLNDRTVHGAENMGFTFDWRLPGAE